MSRTFKSLAEIQTYLEHSAAEIVENSMELERVMAEVMRSAVLDVVYGAYEPEEYERREDDGGLSDVRNMIISDVNIEGDKVKLIFENITMGQDRQIVYDMKQDSMLGQTIADTIEEGIKSNWYRKGEWSNSRPFIEVTANRLRQSPGEMITAIKNSLKSNGFKVS